MSPGAGCNASASLTAERGELLERHGDPGNRSVRCAVATCSCRMSPPVGGTSCPQYRSAALDGGELDADDRLDELAARGVQVDELDGDAGGASRRAGL